MNIAINDSIKRVLKNFAMFQPTGLVLVPLFVTTMNKRIWDEARKGGKEKLLRGLVKVSRGLRNLNIDLRKVFFKQITGAFGGRLEKIVCGGAPLNPELAETFSEFGIDVSEGYGITECAPIIAVNKSRNVVKGSVGNVLDIDDVKIAEPNENGECPIFEHCN